jgi:hypothetical protein
VEAGYNDIRARFEARNPEAEVVLGSALGGMADLLVQHDFMMIRLLTVMFMISSSVCNGGQGTMPADRIPRLATLQTHVALGSALGSLAEPMSWHMILPLL